MKEHSKISRKKFIRRISAILLLPLVWLINVTIERKIESEQKKNKILLPENIAEGITILDQIILIKTGSSIKVFSSRCTHLGCVINKIDNNEIVCPCHGSRFNEQGYPVNGPAAKRLEELAIQTDSKSGEKFVYA